MLSNAAMAAKSIPPIRCRLHFIGCPPAGPWPSGDYHTDGTGGKYTSLPEARRFGVWVCPPGRVAAEYVVGLWSVLHGCVQTVPRSEVYAALLVSVRVDWDAVVTIGIESGCTG